MKWKKNARKMPKANYASLQDSTQELAPEPIRLQHGKPKIVRTHTRDLIVEGEVVATATLKKGDWIFPSMYLHKGLRFAGETKDARYDPEHGWRIYLKGEIRDMSGKIVKLDGEKVDMSGWYLESALTDANMGPAILTLGKMSQSVAELELARERRIRRASARRSA